MLKYLSLFILGIPFCLFAQKDSTKFIHRKPTNGDTTLTTRQDAIYQRPTLLLGKTQTAIGGYVEGNTHYQVTDKAQEFSMEFRRFNIFLYSSIARRIKFLSEIEFEPAEGQVSIETALMDLELNPAFNLRGGILLAPIGGFNQRHDAPLWEFIERPLVATEIIPSTLSEMGFGVFGKLYGHNKVFSYDLYAVNGLQDGIVENNVGRTWLQAGKNAQMLGIDNNSSPAITGKISFRHRKIGEIGLSAYHGVYNSFKKEGLTVAPKRNVSILAIDANATLLKKLAISGEYAYNIVQVPSNVGPFFGSRQQGFYMDLVYPILKRKIFQFENTILNANLRLEAIDYNIGNFTETNLKKYDDIKALVAGFSLRPSANSVLKLNYRWHWTRDLQGNPAVLTGAIQAGFAAYF
ncbi:MAG: hypothetical protein ACKVTZ_23400 [Bacteroidia bacterium]